MDEPAIPVKEEYSLGKRIGRVIWQFAKEKPLGTIAGVMLLIIILIAIIGPYITPYDPLSVDVRARLQPPSADYWFGTDQLGRDVFSRVLVGARIAMLVGVIASVTGITIGTLIGIVSGYLGGKVDMGIQRVMDIIMAFPFLILAIAIMVVLGPAIENVILAIAFPMIPVANRVARSVAMGVKGSTFILAAKAVGASQTRVIFRHVLPNVIASYLIILTSALAGCILAEASLSFLGLGVPPPHPAWGRSLNESMAYFYTSHWLGIFPGIAISLVVFSASLFGDAIRDKIDPYLKKV